MEDKIQTIISELQASELWAVGPCGDEFKLSECILFDGTKPFPKAFLYSKKLFLLKN